ncbi:hypothetical protein [Streptomyces adustus]|uniref:hypothetical protein n=1 Tax=Streptomyces adustus TaxID=1609272 RepID=UPI001EE46838|nr:hypothetical protein [Streptomyces adustus]
MTEPGLDPVRRRSAGVADTRVVVSAEELAAIEGAIEGVLAPYVTRDPEQRPSGARGVRTACTVAWRAPAARSTTASAPSTPSPEAPMATLMGLRATLITAAAGKAPSLLWPLPSPIPGIRLAPDASLVETVESETAGSADR